MKKAMSIGAVLCAVACGGSVESARQENAVECVVSLSKQSTALEVQRAIDAVLLDGADACAGKFANVRTSAELERVETDVDSIRLVFLVRPEFERKGFSPK